MFRTRYEFVAVHQPLRGGRSLGHAADFAGRNSGLLLIR